MLRLLPTAYAQIAPTGIGDAGCRFATGDVTWACIPAYISNLTFIVVSFTASLSLLMLIANGIRYMIGPVGPEQSTDAAKKGMIYAVVGLIISLLTYLLIDTIVTRVTQ